MADDTTPLDTTPPGGGTGTRAPDDTTDYGGYDPITQTGGGTGTRAPTQAPGPAPKPLPPRPPPYVPPKPLPKPAFMTRLRWGILGVLVVGAGVAAYELTPKGKR